MRMYKSFDIPPLTEEIKEYEKEKGENSGDVTDMRLNQEAAAHSRHKLTHIEGTFDPARELREIRTSPDPREALQSFQDKLALQKKGLASMYHGIASLLQRERDTPSEQIEELIRTSTVKYGFSPDQKHEIRRVLWEFKSKREAVREARQKYPNDNDLFSFLFNRAPMGEVKIIDGTITLYIICNDERDYALIYTQKFLSHGGVATEQDVLRANKTGGVSLGSALQPSLQGCIIAENARYSAGSGQTHIHEQQHAVKRLFKNEEQRIINYYDIFEAKDDAELRTCVERQFRQLRREHESRTADEILAYMKTMPLPVFNPAIVELDLENISENISDGIRTGNDVRSILMLSKEKGGLYDYFVEGKKNLISRLLEDLGQEKEELINSAAEKVFIYEYEDLIRLGINAYEALIRRGLPTEKAIGLLTHEPLQKWPKIVARLYGQT